VPFGSIHLLFAPSTVAPHLVTQVAADVAFDSTVDLDMFRAGAKMGEVRL
jgi:hypothetical protein